MPCTRQPRLMVLVVCLLSSVSFAALAEVAAPKDTDRVVDYLNALITASVPSEEGAKNIAEEAADKVEKRTTALAAADGFAASVHDSLADYLQLFQGLINAADTSDDQKSLTIKFNPLPVGYHGHFSIAATARQPEAFQPLLDAIVEPAREAQRDVIEKQTDDFSDVTWTGFYAYQRDTRDSAVWGKTRTLWGRDKELYSELTSKLAVAAVAASRDAGQTEADALLARLFAEAPQGIDAGALTFGDLQRLGPGGQEFISEVLQKVAAAQANLESNYASLGLSRVTELIDNQPQLSISVSLRRPDELVGPEERAVSVSYELGARNFNAVLRKYAAWQKSGDPEREKKSIVDAFIEVADDTNAAEHKTTFSVTYKRTEPFRLTYDYDQVVTDPNTMMDVTIPRSAMLNLARTEELIGKLTWSRVLQLKHPAKNEEEREVSASRNSLSDEKEPETSPSRLLVSAEYVHVNPDTMKQNRFVARATLAIPMGDSVSLPISVTYATRSEFLGEQDHEFSAHVGITYRLGDKK